MRYGAGRCLLDKGSVGHLVCGRKGCIGVRSAPRCLSVKFDTEEWRIVECV